MNTLEMEHRVVIHTDWRGYQMMLEIVGEAPGLRLTYDRGELEIMMTSSEHERKKSNLGSLVECLMLELGLDFCSGGSQTFQRQDLDRGFEPDECYWIQNWRQVKTMRQHDPAIHPPPDLAIEVEVSRGLVNRLGIYRAMKVPEIWRWTAQEELRVLLLSPEGDYFEQANSPTFPDFDPQVLARFARLGNEEATSQILRALRDWLRDQKRY